MNKTITVYWLLITGPPNTFFYLENALKITTEYFFKFLFLFESTIHTYIIGHYNSSAGIISLVSHTTYVVCVSFIYKWRDLQFKANNRVFEKLLMAFFFTLRVFAINLLRDCGR